VHLDRTDCSGRVRHCLASMTFYTFTTSTTVLLCNTSSIICEVDQSCFDERVLIRSHQVSVVVDFWAAWCRPCHTLTAALENAVSARNGAIELAKVDVGCNEELARAYSIQGVPAVAGFQNGEVVDHLTGAISAKRLETFLDDLVATRGGELHKTTAGTSSPLNEARKQIHAYTKKLKRRRF
jgi:thioredoxin